MEKKTGRGLLDEDEPEVDGRSRSPSISEAKPSMRREASKRHSSILNHDFETRSRGVSISEAKVSNEEEGTEAKTSAPTMKTLQSMTGGAYNQAYLIMKARDGADSREVFFRCGNWCYRGDIEFFDLSIGVAELPTLIPTLQR